MVLDVVGDEVPDTMGLVVDGVDGGVVSMISRCGVGWRGGGGTRCGGDGGDAERRRASRRGPGACGNGSVSPSALIGAAGDGTAWKGNTASSNRTWREVMTRPVDGLYQQ